jgi:hypothetical protein
VSIFIKKHIAAFLFSFILVGLTVPAFDTVNLVVELTGFENNMLQVFWSEEVDIYSEKNSITILTTKGRKAYVIPLKNALYLDRVRIDPQQGTEGKSPKPILLHSISYHFNWFYKGCVLDNNFKGIVSIQGFSWPLQDSTTDEVIFTHNDPTLEFEIRPRLRYLQLLMPFLSFLGIYFLIAYLISMPFIKGKKSLYQVDMIMLEDDQKKVAEILDELKNKHVFSRIDEVSLSANRFRLQFVSEQKSISSIYAVLKNFGTRGKVSRLQIIANRGGEIA